MSAIEISEIANYHNNLVQNRILRPTRGKIWAEHDGNMSDLNYPWKMHLYANGYEDWYKLAQVVIPFLLKENATFKTVNFNSEWIGNYPILEENNDQFGKAFTLYPNNQAEFEKLALGLNEILQQAGLSTVPRLDNDYHNIAFEKTLGPTGRIFYRVERDEKGNYVSAREAKRIAPNAPYNPFGVEDPFINLIPNQKQSGVQKEAPQKPQAEQQIKTVSDFFNAVGKLGAVENIARSADGRGGSKYFVPNNELDMEKLQNILTGLSLDYDVHYSKLFGKNVLRVLNSDFQVAMKRLDSNEVQKEAPQKPQAEQQIKTVSDFLNAVGKLGAVENIARSADGRGGSKYFVPNNELDMEKLQNILTGLSLDYDVHYSKLFGKNVLRVLNSDFQMAMKRLDSNEVQKEAPQKPQAEQQIKTVADFFNAVGKLGAVENIARSADGRGGSKYFVPNSELDMEKLQNIFTGLSLDYDVHYSKLFGKNVLRVLNSDFQMAMKRLDSNEVQKEAPQKPQDGSAAEKFRQGKAQTDIQIKEKESGFMATIKSIFKPR